MIDLINGLKKTEKEIEMHNRHKETYIDEKNGEEKKEREMI